MENKNLFNADKLASSNWISTEGSFVWHTQKDDGSPIGNLMRLYHNLNNPTEENMAHTKKRFDDMVDKMNSENSQIKSK